MSDQSRTEYLIAKMLADSGSGWMNTGGSQATRDGHLAGTLERGQREQQRQREKEQEVLRSQAREHSYLQRKRLEEEEAHIRELEERNRRLEDVYHETLSLGEKISAGKANRAELDAYWYLRRSSEGRAKGSDDPSVRRKFSIMLSDLPERSTLKPPLAPQAIYGLALALSKTRKKLLDSGVMLPFQEFNGRYTEFAEDVARASIRAGSDDSGFSYSMYPKQYSEWTRPAWLTHDAPLLFFRQPDVNQDEDEDNHWNPHADNDCLEFNGDLAELSRRFQAITQNRTGLVESIRGLQARFKEFLELEIDRAPLSWLDWSQWEEHPDVDTDGYFGNVLHSPEQSLTFILNHSRFLTQSSAMRPENVLDSLIEAAGAALEEHDAIERATQQLRDWALSPNPNPPTWQAMRAVESTRFLDNTMEPRERLAEALHVISYGICQPMLQTLDKLPHLRSGPSLRASQVSRREFFGALGDALAKHPYYAPKVLDDSLVSLVAQKVTKVRGAFPDFSGTFASLVPPKITDSPVRLLQAWAPVAMHLESISGDWTNGRATEIGCEESLDSIDTPWPGETAVSDFRHASPQQRLASDPGNSRSILRATALIVSAFAVVILSGMIIRMVSVGDSPHPSGTISSLSDYSTSSSGVVLGIEENTFFTRPKQIYLWPANPALKDEVHISINDNFAALCIAGEGCTTPRQFESHRNGSKHAVLGSGLAISVAPDLEGNLPVLSIDGSMDGRSIVSGTPVISIAYKGSLTNDQALIASGAMRVVEVTGSEVQIAEAKTLREFSLLFREDWAMSD